MRPVLFRLSNCVYLPGPCPLPVGTPRGVAVGLCDTISVFPSGTSSAGADEVCGHLCFLPGSMLFLRPALGPVEHVSLTGACAAEADGVFTREREKACEAARKPLGRQMIKLCLDLTHSGGKNVYTCACVFKTSRIIYDYSFKGHTNIDVRGGGQASGSLGETALFVHLEDAGQEGSGVSSKSHSVRTRGMSLCFWFTPVIFTET